MTTATLTQELFSTTLHAITGDEIEDGYLQPGTLVRDLVAIDEGDEETERFWFRASTDGGKTWTWEESFSRPVLDQRLDETATTWRELAPPSAHESRGTARRYLGW